MRHLSAAAAFLPLPDDAAKPLSLLKPGDELRILDVSRGWAWGYGPDGRVGYVAAAAVGA